MNHAERNIYQIVKNEQIADGIFELIINAPGIAGLATPGQFVNLYLQGGAMLLPRPISIAGANKFTGEVCLIYATVGDGTRALSSLRHRIEAMGPLGTGFLDYANNPCIGKAILIGGGVGVPPLLFTAQRLRETFGASIEIKAFLGYREASWLQDRFTKICDDVRTISENMQLLNASESQLENIVSIDPQASQSQNEAAENARVANSYAASKNGNVIDLLNLMREEICATDKLSPASQLLAFSCGPKPMLAAASAWCGQNNIDLRVSLEERMGCGYGACAGCTTKTRRLDDPGKPQAGPNQPGDDGIIKKKICVHGPVFWADEVVW